MSHYSDRDQDQRQHEDTIAFQLYLSGSTDGYEGVVPQSRDFDYLSGYVQGIQRYSESVRNSESIQAQVLVLELTPF